MDQRREFCRLASAPGANLRELCRRFGIAPATGYKWLGRFHAEGDAGLGDRSRRPGAIDLRQDAGKTVHHLPEHLSILSPV